MTAYARRYVVDFDGDNTSLASERWVVCDTHNGNATVAGYSTRDAAQRIADTLDGKIWTLAEIKRVNIEVGGLFFSRGTMRAFGDTMKSFRTSQSQRVDGARVIIRRVRPMRDCDGANVGGVGDVREFDIATGRIGPVINRGK